MKFVINDDSVDRDFRVESNGYTHAFFVDGGTNNLGMGTTTTWPLDGGGSGTASSGLELDMAYDGTMWAGSSYWAGGLKTGTCFWSDASGDHYKRSSRYATMHFHNSQAGSQRFYTADSGTNGNVISWKSQLELNRTDAVFNEDGLDRDFRVESDGNANMLFVDASTNRVGVGTNGPGADFHVYKAGANANGIAQIYQNAATNYPTLYVKQRGEGGNPNDRQGLMIDVAGHNTGDGKMIATLTTNSNINSGVAIEPFTLWNGGTFQFRLGGTINENGQNSDFRVESDNDSHALFVDAGNDRVIVGASASTAGTDFVSFDARPGATGQLIQCGRDDTSTKNQVIFTNPNGTVGSIQTAGSATAYNTSSDARLKENITDADDAGDLIDAIQVRQFDWIADGEHQRYGMVAQELNTVAPEAVSTPENPDEMMGVDYSKLVPMLVKEIQTLRARVAQLESN